MKAIFYILIVLALIFNSVGNLVAFMALRYSAWAESKAKIESNISPDQLVRFAIPKRSTDCHLPDIEFGEREFSYSGTMYDVVRRYETSDSVIVDCLRDEQEEELIEAFIRNHNKSNNGSSVFHALAKLQHIPVYYQNRDEMAITYSTEKGINKCTPIHRIYNSIHSEIDTPPPRTTSL